MNSNFYGFQNSMDHTSPYNKNESNEKIQNSCIEKNDDDCKGDTKKRSTYIVGNSVTFTVNDCDSEIKADAVVAYRDSVRVWGQIKDCKGKSVPYAYVKLLKITNNGLVGVAHTITDCQGFYQFDICMCEESCNQKYTILVGKASTGPEKVVSNGMNGCYCNPCKLPDSENCNCKK